MLFRSGDPPRRGAAQAPSGPLSSGPRLRFGPSPGWQRSRAPNVRRRLLAPVWRCFVARDQRRGSEAPSGLRRVTTGDAKAGHVASAQLLSVTFGRLPSRLTALRPGGGADAETKRLDALGASSALGCRRSEGLARNRWDGKLGPSSMALRPKFGDTVRAPLTKLQPDAPHLATVRP